MTEEIFWNLIGKLDWNNEGDDELVIEPVVSSLCKLGLNEILGFEEILAEKLFTLDTKTHAQKRFFIFKLKGYLSPDDFLCSRCVAVANGKSNYESVLQYPWLLSKSLEFEALLSISPCAYERVTNEVWNHITRVSYETYSNKNGWI